MKWYADWGFHSRLVSFCLSSSLYIAFNAQGHTAQLTLPEGKWRLVVNTEEDWIFHETGAEMNSIELAPYSSCIFRIS